MLKNDRKQYQGEKISDKIEFCRTRNKIVHTDFLDIASKSEAQEILFKEKFQNYFFEGGKEGADRNILVLYPDKISEEMARKNIENIATWKDKKSGIKYQMEIMERNIYDIIQDKVEAKKINDTYFEPIHASEAEKQKFINKYNNEQLLCSIFEDFYHSKSVHENIFPIIEH